MKHRSLRAANRGGESTPSTADASPASGSDRRLIALLEYDPGGKSATGIRGRAVKAFLEGQGHTVDFLSPRLGSVERFVRRRFSLVSRVWRRALGRRTLPHVWDHLADELEPRIRRGGYDLVIGRGSDLAYALTRPLDCVKVLDLANLLHLEQYHAWGSNPAEVEQTYEKELKVWGSVDYIVTHHPILAAYFAANLPPSAAHVASKIRVARMGCDPAQRTAQFSSPPRLVYAGSYYYIQDPYLLAALSKISPYPIDCYGGSDPNQSFLPSRLNYKGFEPGIDFLADYQIGLITVSRDALRQHSPSTKFPYYFAHGLPVLFPEWMKEGYEYPDCAVPFREDNFVAAVAALTERARWERMSAAALARARDLSWDRVLQPLAGLLDSGRRPERPS